MDLPPSAPGVYVRLGKDSRKERLAVLKEEKVIWGEGFKIADII